MYVAVKTFGGRIVCANSRSVECVMVQGEDSFMVLRSGKTISPLTGENARRLVDALVATNRDSRGVTRIDDNAFDEHWLR